MVKVTTFHLNTMDIKQIYKEFDDKFKIVWRDRELDRQFAGEEIKSFLKAKLIELLDECIGEEKKGKKNTPIGIKECFQFSGYNAKRKELIKIKDKLNEKPN